MILWNGEVRNSKIRITRCTRETRAPGMLSPLAPPQFTPWDTCLRKQSEAVKAQSEDNLLFTGHCWSINLHLTTYWVWLMKKWKLNSRWWRQLSTEPQREEVVRRHVNAYVVQQLVLSVSRTTGEPKRRQGPSSTSGSLLRVTLRQRGSRVTSIKGGHRPIESFPCLATFYS
jgi:hypothetical protein